MFNSLSDITHVPQQLDATLFLQILSKCSDRENHSQEPYAPHAGALNRLSAPGITLIFLRRDRADSRPSPDVIERISSKRLSNKELSSAKA